MGSSWADPGAQEEFLADFCEFMVRRLPGLWKRCQEKADVDDLVYVNIRNFVHQTQEKHDPVGSRIYKILKGVVKRALDTEVLYLLASQSEPRPIQEVDGETDRLAGKIRHGSILGFTPRSDPRSAEGVDLAQRVEVWRAELFPDLVTAYRWTEVALRLEACIGGLRDQGVESFRFGELMECLRTQARGWLVTVQRASEGPSAPEDAGDEVPRLVPVANPDTGIEERDFLYQLRRCVIAGVEKLENRRTRDYLLKLWLCLHSWATESSPGRAEARGHLAGLEGDKPPSAKKLSEVLGIPRNRMPGLHETLGHLVKACQSAISGDVTVKERQKGRPDSGPPSGSPSHGPRDESVDMSHKSRLRRLRQEIGEAAARFAEDRARIEGQKRWPPRLGDVFLLPETGAAPVEWVAVEQDPEDLGRLLVVPADDYPSVGSRDVAVPEEMAAGLTGIRCDLGAWLDGETLDPLRRTGVLDLETVSRVRRKREEIRAGSCAGSLLEQEVDQDPEYQEWRQTLAEAHRLLQDRSAAEERASRPAPTGRAPADSRRPAFGGPMAIAASILLLISLGLGGALFRQRARIAGLAATTPAAAIDLPFHHFTGMEPVRGPDQPLVVAATARRMALIFEVAEPEPYPRYRLEVLEKDTEREVWSHDGLTRKGSELSVGLPVMLFASGSYRFRIYGVRPAGSEGEAEPALLEEYALTLELESSPAAR